MKNITVSILFGLAAVVGGLMFLVGCSVVTEVLLGEVGVKNGSAIGVLFGVGGLVGYGFLRRYDERRDIAEAARLARR